mmetsp:Transcript_7652/g.16665  ORF Transcript_7652/g.16665 Transcript_7652/m.16665 type:complete len:94 (-) Transcript_7652:130-411(-)|eukprot:CAMPEP_0183720320 /NCGR_PEP_ID=MMETSP0737-20130205/12963_1 /TAXON_ID=385413 /ORGANISM="Thalassiosira miniscula, Strain CCMP1093" /LENGTH=93 /DNA_ID=CAMNT_0025950165 /DNA_START=682 /DNA_END=963 /DNA_ORIENTATION=-
MNRRKINNEISDHRNEEGKQTSHGVAQLTLYRRDKSFGQQFTDVAPARGKTRQCGSRTMEVWIYSLNSTKYMADVDETYVALDEEEIDGKELL